MPENARIFFVEDDDKVRNLVKRMLELGKHSVVLEATTLSEALKKIEEVRGLGVNVAIIDGSIPDNPKDGPTVAAALKNEAPEVVTVSFSAAFPTVTWGDRNLSKMDVNKLPSLIRSI